jgi:uncharacterized protein YcbX
MSTEAETVVGSVLSLWRYPVKSMMGEELDAVDVTERGIAGDRSRALVDPANGKLVSAKNPRKWPDLFSFSAECVEPPRSDAPIPQVRITLPDGANVVSGDPGLDGAVSAALGRQVTLKAIAPDRPSLEEYWPDIEGLDHHDTVTDEETLAGTFFDGAPIHILTTATLDALREVYPEGAFEPRRFRPNIVIAPSSAEAGFVEDAWIGRVLRLGQQVRISVIRPCPRCVMTTLAQPDLPGDTGILRTAAKQHGGYVGVYAKVLHGGVLNRGDSAYLEQ